MDHPGTKIRNVVMLLVLVVAVVHSSLHFVFYGTGVKGLGETGISGFAVGNQSDEELENSIENEHPLLSPVSKIIVSSEWLVLILLIAGNLIMERRHQVTMAQPALVLEKPKLPQGKSETDLDALYGLLKEQKRIKFSVIAKTFNISKEVAADWANILESGNLASVNYPRMSEPELMFNEKP